MPMMKPTPVEDKCFDPQSCLEELQTFVRSAAGAGTPVHEVERGLWHRLLQLGYQLQSQFFALVGDGDQGETVTVAEGQVVRRLPEPHRRPYQSVFGPFELERVVYGTREGQQIEFVPLDSRLGLPASKFSYLLQDWDQALVVENPYHSIIKFFLLDFLINPIFLIFSAVYWLIATDAAEKPEFTKSC